MGSSPDNWCGLLLGGDGRAVFVVVLVFWVGGRGRFKVCGLLLGGDGGECRCGTGYDSIGRA